MSANSPVHQVARRSTSSTINLPSPSKTSSKASELALSATEKPPRISFEEASILRGTAEYLTTKLTARGHDCAHFPRYRASDTKSPYPTRLGFFHKTDYNISYLDTSKLCEICLADVIPDGYNAWSTFNEKLKVKAGEPAKTPIAPVHDELPTRKWLVISPSPNSYPLLFQAGEENFTGGPEGKQVGISNGTGGTTNAKTIAMDPVSLPVPLVKGSVEAWQWLEAEGKPFYIDQLHLAKGWSPIAEKNGALDAKISAESGTAYKPAKKMLKKVAVTAMTKKLKPKEKENAASPVELPADSPTVRKFTQPLSDV
jgi:hypothetical protein